jgi:AcrR family transcriptional regulator
MLAAMAAAVSEQGYVGTSVADVLRGAGVSRETFYEHFANKEECFLAAFDHAVAALTSRVVSAVAKAAAQDPRQSDDPLARLDAALEVYLEVLASERSLARTFLIEVYGAGPAALRRRVEVHQGFVELIVDALGASDPDRRFACEALVAAVSSMVTMRIALDDHEGLAGLRQPLLRLARTMLDRGGGW